MFCPRDKSSLQQETDFFSSARQSLWIHPTQTPLLVCRSLADAPHCGLSSTCVQRQQTGIQYLRIRAMGLKSELILYSQTFTYVCIAIPSKYRIDRLQ
jgi:hypothetical protein